MPEYHWNHWIDPIVFPYILPVTQIALTGVTCLCVFVVFVVVPLISISILFLISSYPMQTRKYRTCIQLLEYPILPSVRIWMQK